MNTMETLSVAPQELFTPPTDNENNLKNQNQRLGDSVKQAIENYFAHLDGATPVNLYDLVLQEIEAPFLEVVMKKVKGNQCKAAVILGLSRGTLRKKLKQYQLERL